MKILYTLAIIFLCSLFTYSQTTYSSEQEKVKIYLEKEFERTYKNPANLHDEFAEFLEIEVERRKALVSAFPTFRFYVVKTYFSHWIPRDNTSTILVATDADTGEVIGHCWALWYGGGSKSFNLLLERMEFGSIDEAKERVKLLAELIVSIGDRGEKSVGNPSVEGNSISIALNNNWRTLNVSFKGNSFRKIEFINPKEKKSDQGR